MTLSLVPHFMNSVFLNFTLVLVRRTFQCLAEKGAMGDKQVLARLKISQT